ncbi:MAG: endonuclease [Planctomycetota bacterium]
MRIQPIWLSLVLASPVLAQGAPAGYYNTVDTSSPLALRQSLHAVIDDHLKLPYTGGSVDTWDVLRAAQEDPANSNNILDIYKNASYVMGSTDYNREHSWPKSFGFPNDGPDNYPYTDCHMLFLADAGYNTARSNRPFRLCSASCTEYPTVGGASGSYPSDSNWGSGSFSAGTWQVWSGRKGDMARALLYADVRYEGGTHGVTGVAEPDLILTNFQSLISGSQTGSNESVAYMGELDVLLQWHAQDPPDAWEMARNDIVYSYQGNRNPFIDHPEWVDCLFGGNCGPTSSAELYCTPGEYNSSGNPASIGWFGSLVSADNNLHLEASSVPANQFAYFLCGTARGFVYMAGGSQGNLCVGGTIGRFNLPSQIQYSGPFGHVAVQVDLSVMPLSPNQAVQPGDTWTFQCWYRDVNPTTTSNFTDALEVVFE